MGCIFRLGPSTIYPRLHTSIIPRMTKFASLGKFLESYFARGIREGTPFLFWWARRKGSRDHLSVGPTQSP